MLESDEQIKPKIRRGRRVEMTLNDMFILYGLLSLADDDGIIRMKKSQIKKILLKHHCINNINSTWIINQVIVKLEKYGIISKHMRFKSEHYHNKFENFWSGYHFYYQIENWELAYLILQKMPTLPKPQSQVFAFVQSKLNLEQLALAKKLAKQLNL